MPKRNKQSSPFQLFHGALNSASQSKDDLWDVIIKENTEIASLEAHDLRSKYGINQNRANTLSDALRRHCEEKEIYAIVKTNRKKWKNMAIKNTNHKCKVGTNNIKMFLPSSIINRRLIEDGYLSDKDTLRFDPGFCAPYTEFPVPSFERIPNAMFRLSKSDGITGWGDIKSCIGTRFFFDCNLIFDIFLRDGARTRVSFWAKICTDQTFIGNGQITHCMTVSNDYKYIELSDDVVLRATSKNGAGVLGVGYGNLIPSPKNKTKKKKAIDGYLMLWVHEMYDIDFSFYRRRSSGEGIQNISVSLESKNLKKNNKPNPLVLFDYQMQIARNAKLQRIQRQREEAQRQAEEERLERERIKLEMEQNALRDELETIYRELSGDHIPNARRLNEQIRSKYNNEPSTPIPPVPSHPMHVPPQQQQRDRCGDDESDYETASDEDHNQQFNTGGAQGQLPPQQQNPGWTAHPQGYNNNPQQQYQQGTQQSFYGQQQGYNNNPQQQYQQSPQQSFYGQQRHPQFYGQPPPGSPQQQPFLHNPQQQYQQNPQDQTQSFYGQQNPQQQQPFYGRQPRGPPPGNNVMPNQMGYGMNAQPQQGGYQSEPLTPKPVTPQIPAIRAVPVPSHSVNYANTHPYCPSNMGYPYSHVYPQNGVPQLPTQHEERRRSWNEDSASPDIAEMSPEMRPLSEHSSDTDSMNMYMHMQNSVFCPSIADLESDENDKKRKRRDDDDVGDNDIVSPSKKRRLN